MFQMTWDMFVIEVRLIFFNLARASPEILLELLCWNIQMTVEQPVYKLIGSFSAYFLCCGHNYYWFPVKRRLKFWTLTHWESITYGNHWQLKWTSLQSFSGFFTETGSNFILSFIPGNIGGMPVQYSVSCGTLLLCHNLSFSADIHVVLPSKFVFNINLFSNSGGHYSCLVIVRLSSLYSISWNINCF